MTEENLFIREDFINKYTREYSVTPQHLILLLRFLGYKNVNIFTNRNGKFSDLPIELFSGGVRHPRTPL